MNMQRISAIFEKDMKDFMKNSMTVFAPIVPIILSLFYRRMGVDTEELSLFLIYFIIGMTLSSISTGLMMMMMAEEKEKNTLRGLIMSPASMVDIIIGKSLVTTLITFITLFISLLILDLEQIFDVHVIINSFLLFIFFLLLGIGIGLFVKSVGATTVYAMPIMFLFGLTPIIETLGFSEEHIIIRIFNYFPLMRAMEFHESGSWLALFTIIIWIVLAGVFTFICFVKTSKDR